MIRRKGTKRKRRLVKQDINMSCNNLLFKVSTWKSTNIAIQPKLPLVTTTRWNCIAV